MRPCPACKSSIADEHRFCGYCGARMDDSLPKVVPAAPISEPSEVSHSIIKGAAPSQGIGAKTRPDAPRSPLATSAVMDSPALPRIRTAPQPATPSVSNMPRVKRDPTDPPNATNRRGVAVVVTWFDGRKYAGTLERIEGGQCLILFQDGQQRWLERALVEFVK